MRRKKNDLCIQRLNDLPHLLQRLNSSTVRILWTKIRKKPEMIDHQIKGLHRPLVHRTRANSLYPGPKRRRRSCRESSATTYLTEVIS